MQCSALHCTVYCTVLCCIALGAKWLMYSRLRLHGRGFKWARLVIHFVSWELDTITNNLQHRHFEHGETSWNRAARLQNKVVIAKANAALLSMFTILSSGEFSRQHPSETLHVWQRFYNDAVFHRVTASKTMWLQMKSRPCKRGQVLLTAGISVI